MVWDRATFSLIQFVYWERDRRFFSFKVSKFSSFDWLHSLVSNFWYFIFTYFFLGLGHSQMFRPVPTSVTFQLFNTHSNTVILEYFEHRTTTQSLWFECLRYSQGECPIPISCNPSQKYCLIFWNRSSLLTSKIFCFQFQNVFLNFDFVCLSVGRMGGHGQRQDPGRLPLGDREAAERLLRHAQRHGRLRDVQVGAGLSRDGQDQRIHSMGKNSFCNIAWSLQHHIAKGRTFAWKIHWPRKNLSVSKLTLL